MPFKDIAKQRASNLKYEKTDKGKASMRRYLSSPKGKRVRAIHAAKYNFSVKMEVLTYYGKGGKAICNWRGCTVSDLDMLSLDHINNNGYEDRKQTGRSGGRWYAWLRAHGFPKGLQTLCMNHQLKKKIMRGAYYVLVRESLSGHK